MDCHNSSEENRSQDMSDQCRQRLDKSLIKFAPLSREKKYCGRNDGGDSKKLDFHLFLPKIRAALCM
jgi:hypothetical protein